MDNARAVNDGSDPRAFDDIDPLPASRLDDRRVQIRVYRRWMSLLRGRSCPTIHEMGGESLEGPYNVLLDLRGGNGDPVIARIGQALREQCSDAEILSVRDAPPDSLLSRLT